MARRSADPSRPDSGRTPQTATFYGRKSNKDNGKSVAQQRTVFVQDCSREGVAVGQEFADPDRSASRYATRDRPGYAELLTYISSGQCELLVLWEASRGSRKLSEWTLLLDLCRDAGVHIRILDHHRTYNLAEWRDYKTLAEEGIDAHGESERLSGRVRRGRRSGVENGRPGGPAHFGYEHHYDLRGNWLETVPNANAAVVTEIVRRVLAREPLLAIARDLTERGVPAPRGEQWYGTTIRDIARNPAYAGKAYYLGLVVGEAPWPRLVSEEDHAEAVVLLSDPGRQVHRGNEQVHLLSGVITCGVCGSCLRPHKTGRNRIRVYCCVARGCMKVAITISHADAFVEAMVLARLAQPDASQFFAPPDSTLEIATARREERELRARLDALYAEAAAGRLTARALSATASRLEPLLADAERKVRRLATEAASPLAHLVDVDVPARWAGFTARQRREIVAAVCVVIAAPARGARRFDPARLGRSHWVGAAETWADAWGSGGSA